MTCHWLSIAAAAWLCTLLGPQSVQAQDGGHFDPCDSACSALVVGLVLVPPIVLAVADLAYGVQDRFFPVGWAVPELAYGTLLGTLSVAIVVNADEAPAPAFYLLGGIALWFITHAVLSLIIGDAGPPKKPRVIEAAVLPLPDGVWGGVRLRS